MLSRVFDFTRPPARIPTVAQRPAWPTSRPRVSLDAHNAYLIYLPSLRAMTCDDANGRSCRWGLKNVRFLRPIAGGFREAYGLLRRSRFEKVHYI